ncbi:MAG: RNA 3'-terminal phosphate cyclase [Thermoplasmata archaeon]
MITIDGSHGEGGGQILRTAVAMSIVKGTPVKITNIRANRPNPGLSYQHLAALNVAAEICGGELEGGEKGSPEVEFIPGEPRGGYYEFDIGTAGSIALLLQCMIPPALQADGVVEVKVKGGTDVKWSPPYDFFENVFLEHLRRMGLNVSSKLLKRGHYPKGGGEVVLTVEPGSPNFLPTGEDISKIKGRAFVTSLPEHIMRRMRKQVLKEFVDIPVNVELRSYDSLSPGAGITLWTEGDRLVGIGELGEKGVPAESVGKEAADYIRSSKESRFHLDRWSADQIVPYLAMSQDHGELKLEKRTGHLETNIWVMYLFESDWVKLEERNDGLYLVY